MGGLQMVCPNAVWYDDEVMLNWPVQIPKEKQPEASQMVEKEYTMVYALRMTDVEPGVIRAEQLMWISFSPLSARGEWGHKYQAEGFAHRLAEHLGA
jgi:hypothetical protein